jgi:RNA polymerase sigma factor (sigma-70 family)
MWATPIGDSRIASATAAGSHSMPIVVVHTCVFRGRERYFPVPTAFVPFEPDPDDREHMRRMINRLIKRRIIDEHDAKDLSQEILSQLWQQLQKLDPSRGDRGAYAYKLISNVLSHYLRHRRTPKRNPRWLKPSEQPIKGTRSRSVPFVDSDPRQQHDLRHGDRLTPQQEIEREIDLTDALERLPTHLRDLLERLLAGMTVAEAADDLDIDRSTAYRRVALIAERFRQIFPDGL